MTPRVHVYDARDHATNPQLAPIFLPPPAGTNPCASTAATHYARPADASLRGDAITPEALGGYHSAEGGAG